MSYVNEMKNDLETKKVCPLCRRQNEKDVDVCFFCKYVFNKDAVNSNENRDISQAAENAKVCPYCLGCGTTVGGKCQFCEGSGKFTETGIRITCGYCTGTGTTVGGTCYMCEGKGWVSKIVDKKVCRYCSGSGTTIGGNCSHCDGRGVITVDEPTEQAKEEGEKTSEGNEDVQIEEVPPPPPPDS